MVILYYDGQFDDARLAVELGGYRRKAWRRFIKLLQSKWAGKRKCKVCGVMAFRYNWRQNFKIKSKVVVNATGVFADGIMQMDAPGGERLVAPSQGIHLVVDRHFFPGENAMMIPKTDDGRVLFAVPWHNKVVLGTTDTPVEHTVIEPKPLEEENWVYTKACQPLPGCYH